MTAGRSPPILWARSVNRCFRVRRYLFNRENQSPLIRLLNNLLRTFVIPERDEFRVAQMVRSGPLEEIDPHNNLGLEP